MEESNQERQSLRIVSSINVNDYVVYNDGMVQDHYARRQRPNHSVAVARIIT